MSGKKFKNIWGVSKTTFKKRADVEAPNLLAILAGVLKL